MHTSETPRLYARDPLLHSLLPRLTGLAYAERARVPWEHDKDLPLVLLTGRHGMGRTAVLRALERHYAGRLPLALVDTAACALVVELLEELVCSLAPGLGRRFPLLLPGLISVFASHGDTADGRGRATTRIARLLIACHLESGTEANVAQRWAGRLRTRLDDAPRAGAGAEAGAGEGGRAVIGFPASGGGGGVRFSGGIGAVTDDNQAGKRQAGKLLPRPLERRRLLEALRAVRKQQEAAALQRQDEELLPVQVVGQASARGRDGRRIPLDQLDRHRVAVGVVGPPRVVVVDALAVQPNADAVVAAVNAAR